jgi:hypothetical protein
LRLPDSSPLPARWGIRCLPEVARGWTAPGSSVRLTRGDGSLRPPAKSPRARQGFGSQPDAVQASSPQAVASTTGSGRFAAAPRRRVTPDVLTRLVRTARGSAPRVSRTITSEYRSPARGPDELLEPLPDLVVPRSLSAKDAQDVHRDPSHDVADAMVKEALPFSGVLSGTSATRTATSGNSRPTPEPLGSGWREPRSPVASGKGRRVRGRRRTHTRRRRTARRTGMHSWPSRSPVREAS